MKVQMKGTHVLKRLGLLTVAEVKDMLDNIQYGDRSQVKTEDDHVRLFEQEYGDIHRKIENTYRPFVWLDWNGRKEMGAWLNTMLMGHLCCDGEYFDMVNQFNKMILRAKGKGFQLVTNKQI